MIRSFGNKLAQHLYHGTASKETRRFPPDLKAIAQRKLDMLQYVTTLESLLIPPSNRLEALKGNRSGQHSIRINDQWRLCFVWRDGDIHDVEIVDYH